MKILLATILLGVFLTNAATCVCADDAQQNDDALLEDLGAELLGPTSRKPASESVSPLDQQLLEQLGEGVGGGQGSQDDWISKVVGHMQSAQLLLEQSEDASSAISAQTEALTGLDAIIAELTQRQSRCNGGQCQGGGKCEKPGQESKPGKKPGSSSKAGKSPSSSSTTNSDADLSPELAVAGELVKDLWGKLPKRQREQILQPLSEEFLPKYASEIEAYFRALADPNRNLPESP